MKGHSEGATQEWATQKEATTGVHSEGATQKSANVKAKGGHTERDNSEGATLKGANLKRPFRRGPV